jgi:hypothetical protein
MLLKFSALRADLIDPTPAGVSQQESKITLCFIVAFPVRLGLVLRLEYMLHPCHVDHPESHQNALHP